MVAFPGHACRALMTVVTIALYAVRMEKHDAARALANARWRGAVVSRAVQTVVERQDELTDGQRAQLAAVAGREDANRER